MVHVLGTGKDSKGINVKITHNDISKETIVTVFHGELVKTEVFDSNRFGFHIHDSVKALEAADRMAIEIEKEKGL